jgi:CRP/FNR family transcriptional regulator
LRHLVGLVEDLSLRQVSSRLAKLLIETASGQQEPLTQQEMAARLGTVREIIGRSLKQLEARGLIRIERGKIVVLDRAGLERMI